MKKYLLNGKEVPRSQFFASLKQDCRKVVSTVGVGGDFSADLCEYDEAKYAKAQRDLRKGSILLMMDAGRTYMVQ